MSILTESYQFLQTNILPSIPAKHKKLFTFGFSALSLNSFTSLNSNARMTVANRNTAESKIKRLMRKEAMITHFTDLVSVLNLVSPTDTINVDFSTFCGFQVLTFAKQTQLGRAIPVYIAAITYPVENPGSQTQFIISEVKKLTKLLGFCPHLVFDRGFELPYLAHYLVRNHILFTIRMRKDKHILYQGKEIPLRNLPWFENDCTVGIYGRNLRIVRSEKKKTMKEPWYLLTNNTNHTRDQVVAYYYFRFEIEETFKDLKHIFELNKFYTITKKQTFLILLWFFILGMWISFLLTSMKVFLHERILQNKHKKLSFIRFFFEQIQLAKTTISFMPP